VALGQRPPHEGVLVEAVAVVLGTVLPVDDAAGAVQDREGV
jgi:hypothetical protein